MIMVTQKSQKPQKDSPAALPTLRPAACPQCLPCHHVPSFFQNHPENDSFGKNSRFTPESSFQFSHAADQFRESRFFAVNHRITHILVIVSPIVKIIFWWNQTDTIADVARIVHTIDGRESFPMMLNMVPKAVIMNGGNREVFVHHPIEVI